MLEVGGKQQVKESLWSKTARHPWAGLMLGEMETVHWLIFLKHPVSHHCV